MEIGRAEITEEGRSDVRSLEEILSETLSPASEARCQKEWQLFRKYLLDFHNMKRNPARITTFGTWTT